MTITRANLEAVIIARCGPLLTAADMDGTTVAGTNASLNDPISTALRRSGYSVSNIALPSTTDLAAVIDDDVSQVIDLAELRTLENIAGNLDDVDISAGGRSESLNQLSAKVEKRIDRMTAKVKEEYGIGVGGYGTLSGGAIGLDFMSKDGDADAGY
jgi:hypothetical protein